MDWGPASIAVTVVLSVIAIVLTVKLSRRKKPAWRCLEKEVIGLDAGTPPELKLYFEDVEVKNVYQTRLIFLNRGTDTIRREDVTRPITFIFKNCKVLRKAYVVSASRPEIELNVDSRVNDADYAVEINFRFLDHKDGGVVDFLHAACQDMEFQGNIMGTRITRITGFDERERSFRANSLTLLGSVALGMMGLFALADAVRPPEDFTKSIVYQITTGRPEGIAYLIILGTVAWGFARGLIRYFRARSLPEWYWEVEF